MIQPFSPPVFLYTGTVISVDMQSGLINKLAVTPANITDAKGMEHVLPDDGTKYADKGYCVTQARIAAARKGVYLRAIKKKQYEREKF